MKDFLRDTAVLLAGFGILAVVAWAIIRASPHRASLVKRILASIYLLVLLTLFIFFRGLKQGVAVLPQFLTEQVFPPLGEAFASLLEVYVGRRAEVMKTMVLHEDSRLGMIAALADTWPADRDSEVRLSLDPGVSFEVIGVSRPDYTFYLTCRYTQTQKEVMFAFPAEFAFSEKGYISWK